MDELIPFSPDHETARVEHLLRELFTHVLYDEEPLFISDEATIWDVSMSDPAEILERLATYYQTPVTMDITRQPLWSLVEALQAKRGTGLAK